MPFLAYLQKNGAPALPVFQTSYCPESLDLTNPNAILPTNRVWAFIERCAVQLQDLDTGWNTAMTYGLLGAGAFGHQLENQPCLREAIQLYAARLTTHASVSTGRIASEHGVSWFMRGTLPPKGSSYWQVEQYALGTMLHILRCYLGETWRPRTIKVVSKPAGLYQSAIARNCECIIAGADRAGIEVPNDLLDAPPCKLENVQNFPGPPAAPFPDSLPEALIAILSAYVGEYPISLHTAALITDLHPRALHRRLKEHNVTFRDVRDSVLEQAAKSALSDYNLPISTISLKLGYANQSAFSRAFTRLAGCSPQKYRENIGELRQQQSPGR